MMEKGLGRLYLPDTRDAAFPMKAVLPEKAPGITYKYWWPGGWWGNQGANPFCIGFSWVHWLEDGGVTHNNVKPPIVDPAWLYREAQKVDIWPGESYDGTSVRAGAKILQSLGFISEYRWTQDVKELALAILTKGPVVVGTDWYYDMFFPSEKGFIRPTGQISGGHAYILNGCNTEKEVFRIKNSWGRSWGKNGYAYIRFDDMQKLLEDYGECCLAIEKRLE